MALHHILHGVTMMTLMSTSGLNLTPDFNMSLDLNFESLYCHVICCQEMEGDKVSILERSRVLGLGT